jgi:hypothetical protein
MDELTLKEFAAKKKVHPVTVQRWLTSKKKIKYLGITVVRNTPHSPYRIFEKSYSKL